MKRGRIPFAILSIFLILLLNLLAASPALHELLHPDAGKPDHHCAVTVFGHGQVDSSTVDVAAAIPVQSFEFVPSAYISVFSPTVDTLPPGRAPPTTSAVS